MAESTNPIKTIDSARVVEAMEEERPIIDVRPAAMYDAGHIPGAVNLPLVRPEDGSMVPDEEIVQAMEAQGVGPEDDVVLYCQTGYHAALAAQTLAHEGYEDIELYSGSMEDWNARSMPVED